MSQIVKTTALFDFHIPKITEMKYTLLFVFFASILAADLILSAQSKPMLGLTSLPLMGRAMPRQTKDG